MLKDKKGTKIKKEIFIQLEISPVAQQPADFPLLSITLKDG